MIKMTQLIQNVIVPTLMELGLDDSENLEKVAKLLIITAAIESNLGTYLKQIPNGPALGIYQMEPNTYNDLWERYLKRRIDLRRKVLKTCGYACEPGPERMVSDLKYATVMARIFYYSKPDVIPHYEDGMIEYYYNHWYPNREHTSLEEAKLRYKNVLVKERNC